MTAWIAARGLGPSDPQDALVWLESQNLLELLTARLRPVLLKLWVAAWDAGVTAAETVTGATSRITAQALQDLLNQFSFAWVQEIAATRVKRIAQILAGGGNSSAQLELKIKDMLSDKESARLIAQTEVTRAMSAATAEVYRLAGIGRVRWVIEDNNACELCTANSKAEPRYLGQPFPSGAAFPPQHGRCRCALLPE